MVLLSSTAVGGIITSSIICLFTFLLFLSGYVLQQQTVRSLQEALQAPLEERVWIPQRSPAQEQQGPIENVITRDGSLVDTTSPQIIIASSINSDPSPSELQSSTDVSTSNNAISSNTDLRALWRAHLNLPPSSDPEPSILEWNTPLLTKARLAYTHLLSNPNSVCSIILLTKTHTSMSTLPSQHRPRHIYLYPSTWDTLSHTSAVHKQALFMLVKAEHEYDVLLHPVHISSVWTGVDVESQLLSELARNPWQFDRTMYLRHGGVLVDADGLDKVLVESFGASKARFEADWKRLRSLKRAGNGSGSRDEMDLLLWAQGRGLMAASEGVRERVVGRSDTARRDEGEENVLGNEKVEKVAEVAYVFVGREEVEREGKSEFVQWYGNGLRDVCAGADLLDV